MGLLGLLTSCSIQEVQPLLPLYRMIISTIGLYHPTQKEELIKLGSRAARPNDIWRIGAI